MLPRSSWGTLLLAYKLVLGVGRPTFVRLMKWPFLAFLAAALCQVLSTGTAELTPDGSLTVPPMVQAGNLILQLGAGAVALAGMTGWARWVLEPSAPGRFQWRREEWVTLGRLIQVYLFAVVAMLVVVIVSYIALDLIMSPDDAPSLSKGGGVPIAVDSIGIMGAIPVLAGMAAAMAVIVRFSLSPVAATAGHPSDLASAAGASRAGRWHMFWTILLYMPTALVGMLPLVVLGLMLAAVLASVAANAFMLSVWVNIILMVFYIPIALGLSGVFVAVFAIYYRWLALKDLSH